MMDLSLKPDIFSDQDARVLMTQGWLATRKRAFGEKLLKNARLRVFDAGAVIYHVGDIADGLYGVVSGTLNISVPADDGQEFVADREGSGFWIGDLALLAGLERLVTVEAVTPVRTAFVPAENIRRMLAECPDDLVEFYSLSHENTRQALRIMANTAVQNTEQRLVLRLLQLGDSLAQPNGQIVVSQAELARMVAVSVPTLQRCLLKLSDDGMIEQGYGHIRIADRRGLMTRGKS